MVKKISPLVGVIFILSLLSSGCDENAQTTEATGSKKERWTYSYMGSLPSYVTDLAIGDGNGDGIDEVYCSDNISIFQFRLAGSLEMTEVANMGSDDFRVNGITVGDGDGDGINEVYGADRDYHIYQFSWTGSEWTKNDLGTGAGRMVDVVIGDMNADGSPEVYSDCGNYIYQFKWNGSEWEKSYIDSCGMSFGEAKVITLGECDGDGIKELYYVYSDHGTGRLFQLKWTISGWVSTEVCIHAPYRFVAGDVDGDGLDEIYGGSAHSYVEDDLYHKSYYISQFKWNGQYWRETHFGVVDRQEPIWPPYPAYEDVDLGDANGDGIPELYAGSETRHLYQFKWDGSDWILRDLGEVMGAVYRVATGDADADGFDEVYVADTGDRLYQFKIE